MKIKNPPQEHSRRTLRRSLSVLAVLFATCAPLSAQTQTITVNANSHIRDIPAGLGGVVALTTFWNSLSPNYRDDMINARIGAVRIPGYPTTGAGGSIEELDMRVAQILNVGGRPVFIQYIKAETNTAFKNKLLRTDGTLYPAGDTTPIAQRVATNLAFLVNRYKSAPFNLTTQYWEIGNEPDITVDYKVSTPQEYIGFFSAAHNQLVASGVRGNVLLAGPVISFEYGYDTGRDTFMRDFLDACGDQVDIVTRHVYATIYNWETTVYTPYVLLNSSLETLHFDSSFVAGGHRGEGGLLKTMNDHGVPSSVGTGVTEMNVGINGDGNGFSYSITQGLWFLLSHHYALQNPRSLLTNAFMFDRVQDGYQDGHLAFYTNTKARSFAYWALYMHGVLTGNEVVAATSNTPRLVVTATKDDAYLYVQVINRDTNSYTANVTINNAPPVTAATRFNLSATATPDTGIATTHGTSFTETFAPMTASVFRFPRTDAPVPPIATPPATISTVLNTSFDTVPTGMLTYANGFTPVISGGRLQLTGTTANQSSAVVFKGQAMGVARSRFQARFGFKVVGTTGQGFVFGAYSANPLAVGPAGPGLGYVGQNNRLWGVKFDNSPNQLSVISNVTNAAADGWATKTHAELDNVDLFAVIDYDGSEGTVRARLHQGTDATGTLIADVTNRIGNPSALPVGTVFGFTGGSGQTTHIESLAITMDYFTPGAEMIIDNTATSGVTVTGAWDPVTTPATYHGTNFLTDGNTGKGTKSVRFKPTLQGFGWRDVYIRWPQSGSFATNVPITVVHADGTTAPGEITVDQTTGASDWVKIGTWRFVNGSVGSVQINTTGTTGTVAADAVRFVNVAAP
ncbi:hypothetical protein [Rariglobus hedericola]|uniref:Golvesin/Xly CBD-like domain-containing protein n=1 Tax=Rariglobus hedericola TaxID=2597822 RepID=A0A556QS86_9BACT|nr:hypothetical protein [Rariglobus hedericola]TSJ79506.1 hypothetical protein FPL22_09525 [Rariglobus hedericola]